MLDSREALLGRVGDEGLSLRDAANWIGLDRVPAAMRSVGRGAQTENGEQ